MMKKSSFAALLLTLIAALWMAGCGGSQPVEVSVEMREFAFEPDSVTVPAGQEVTLHATNTGALEHHFAILKQGEQVTLPYDQDDLDKVYWEVKLDHGENTTVTFTAPSEPGEYTVVCGTPGHLEQGMQAKLIVTQ